MARYSEAHKRAIAKYQKANYYRITGLLPKSIELVVKERIKSFGSINAYINYLVRKDLDECNTNISEIEHEPFSE